MKILHIIDSLTTGGAERLVSDLAPLQRARGNDVVVLALCGGNTPFRKILDDAGIRVFDFGANANLYSPLNIFRIIPFLKKYDIVHAHLFPAQYWVALAKVFSFSKTPLVTTEHSTYNRRRDLAGARVFDRWIYRRYAKIFGISEKTTEALKKHLGDENAPVFTVSNGADIEKIKRVNAVPRNEIVPETCATFLMQVAGFREAKDQDTVIRALKILPGNVFVAFVGDGVRRAECERLATALGVRERVRFLGVRADVPALLKAADIVVMSSRWEGFGLAAVEGMAAGKPTVASNVPGLAEVVGGAGILFPSSDEKALAKEILKLSGDRVFYEEIAARCSRRANDFDIRKMSDAYCAAYEKTVKTINA